MSTQLDHPYREDLDRERLWEHLVSRHTLPEPQSRSWEASLVSLVHRHRHEHRWPHIAPGLAPRPQDVDPITESEYRALWGDR